MPSFKIASISHPTYGDMELHFQGPNRALIITKYSPDGCPPGKETTIVPRSLLHAIELLDEIERNGGCVPGGYRLEQMDWNLDEFKAEQERIEELQEASKRRAIYTGAPSLGCLTQYLNELLDKNPFLAFYPVFVCGTTWYLHIDEGQNHVLLDNELLYEDYELTR